MSEDNNSDFSYDYDFRTSEEFDSEEIQRREDIQRRIEARRQRAEQLAKDRAKAKLVMLLLGSVIIIVAFYSVSKTLSSDSDGSVNSYEAMIDASNASQSSGVSDERSESSYTENASEYETDIADEAEDYGSEVSERDLYYLFAGTQYYSEGDIDVYADGTATGFFTGTPSEEYTGYIEIDAGGQTAFINASSAVCAADSKALALSVISQYTSIGGGVSGCGVACLSMMAQSARYDNYEYEALLDYAESNGYADQGSLHSANGGITITSLQQLASDYFGITLTNAYSSSGNVQETVKSLIDSGKQALVLVALDNNANISTSGTVSHFIVVTGYYDTESGLQFLCGDTLNSSEAISLSRIDGELLEASASSYFEEPNTIAFIDD